MNTKRITLEEAKQNFLPKPQTLPLNKDAFFTLIPDPEDNTWEHVHYWIGKQYFNATLSFNEGYIYMLLVSRVLADDILRRSGIPSHRKGH